MPTNSRAPIKKHLMDAFNWGKTLIIITNEEINTILHSRKSFLFYSEEGEQKLWYMNGQPEKWLVISIHYLLVGRAHPRESSTAIILPCQEIDRLRKKIIKIFQNHRIKILFQSGMKFTHFLVGISLNLDNGS